MTVTDDTIRSQFFEFLFGTDDGHICIATQKPQKRETFKQAFFRWPQQRNELIAFISQIAINHNVWFCINLLTKAERKKEFCLPTNLVWSDLDACKPDNVEPPPQLILESSPGRYQAVWRLDKHVDPLVAEMFSKKIAYRYVQGGADPSGWDLTQLLRVPLTFNHKYSDNGTAPKVELSRAAEVLLPVEVFEILPVPGIMPSEVGTGTDEMPDVVDLPESAAVLYKYWHHLERTPFVALHGSEPPQDADWSKLLWRLIHICFEAGMSAEETFSVVLVSRCNKYERDNRPITYLWREIKKAEAGQQRITMLTGTFRPLAMPTLLTESESKKLPKTIVDEYREWASQSTDALMQFHDLSCFVLLSALTASGLYCDVSYGKTVPNIWGLILGDSTLTRKTTAMRMAMEFISEIDRDLVLATDGSAEGLLSGLSGRPNRVSIYYKDEVSGFFDSITRKDYLAGMPETMTQLYDVPEFFTRRLRKETISILSPIFIFFGGGIRERTYNLITEEYILSGFLPRFLIVTGETDMSRIRRTGPKTELGADAREILSKKFRALHNSYTFTSIVEIGGQQTTIEGSIEVKLTDDAWERYGEIEELMVQAAHESPIAMFALPTFERLSRSLLKMAMLLAAARQEPNEGMVECTLQDILGAAKYIQDWGRYSVDLLLNSGKGSTQRLLDKVLRSVEKTPGLTRSDISRSHHFTKKAMDEIISTLEDRQQIKVEKAGNGTRIWPI